MVGKSVATEVNPINRTMQILVLFGTMVGLSWTQETTPTIEQLRQQWEQMEREKTAILSPAWRAIGRAESLHQSGQWQRPLDKYLASAPFPMPPALSTNRSTSPLYVQVVQVSRADAQVLRHYPYSHTDFPYYEVKVRILETWGGYTNEDPSEFVNIPFRLKPGQQIRLLWVARRQIEGSFRMDDREYEQARAALRATQIWEVGKRYLLFGFRGFALDMPREERDRYPSNLREWLQGPLQPPLEKVFFLVMERPPSLKYAPEIEQRAFYPEPPLCSRVPYWVLPSPPKELLKLLEEERVVLRYTREERLQWVSQRVRDPNVPLWKRQRALLYLRNRDCLESPERYLQWLKELEPPLRAFGLQRFAEAVVQQFSGWDCERMPSLITEGGEQSWIARAFRALRPFLAAEQPVEVRREAAWLFADWLTVPQHITDWERRAKLGLDWWHQWRDWLREQSQQEEDKVVRLLLDASWRQIVGWEHHQRMNEVLQQLQALERERSGKP